MQYVWLLVAFVLVGGGYLLLGHYSMELLSAVLVVLGTVNFLSSYYEKAVKKQDGQAASVTYRRFIIMVAVSGPLMALALVAAVVGWEVVLGATILGLFVACGLVAYLRRQDQPNGQVGNV